MEHRNDPHEPRFVFEKADDFVNRDAPDNMTDPRELHAFYQDRKKRYERYLQSHPPGNMVRYGWCELPHTNLTEEEICQAAVDFAVQDENEIWGRPEVTKISFRQMVGDGYDFDKRQYGHINSGLIISNAGLALALLDPPYGINLPGIKVPQDLATSNSYYEYWYSEDRQRRDKALAKGEIMHNYLDFHLGVTRPEQADHLCIWKADDNWSDFFLEGKEWWGTFFYLVEDQRQNVLHVFAASTTD